MPEDVHRRPNRGVSPMTRLLTALGTCLVLGLPAPSCAQDEPLRRPRTCPSLTGKFSSTARADANPRKRTPRWSSATGCAPRLGAPKFCSATGRHCTSTSGRRIDINGDNVVRLLEGRLVVFAEGGAGSLQVDSAPARCASTAAAKFAFRC